MWIEYSRVCVCVCVCVCAVRFQKSVFKRCDPYWWTQLFYLQNFIPFDSDKVCIGWSWYLGNDMCFFLITPLLLLGYEKRKAWGWTMLGILFAATIGITGGLVEYFKLGLYIYDKHFQDYAYYAYSKPYTRVGAYLVGIAAALFYNENTAYLKRVHRYYYRALTTLAIITMNVIVFAVRNESAHSYTHRERASFFLSNSVCPLKACDVYVRNDNDDSCMYACIIRPTEIGVIASLCVRIYICVCVCVCVCVCMCVCVCV